MSTALRFYVTGEHFIEVESKPRVFALPGLGRRSRRLEPVFIPKIVCAPEHDSGDTLKIGVFAGLHGDEQAGTLACFELMEWAGNRPSELSGYELHFYPVCNPTGQRNCTRESQAGVDLNREFWRGSEQPEVQALELELHRERYDGIISLHADDLSDGVYGFANGAMLSQDILEPALAAAATILPRNSEDVIDGFPAVRGIIADGYPGVLSAPPEQRPHALEIVFETPALAPMHAQVRSTVLAVKTMLAEFLLLQAHAPNL